MAKRLVLKADDLFDSLNDEKPYDSRKIKIDSTPELRRLCEEFEGYYNGVFWKNKCEFIMPKTIASSDDIAKFIVVSKKYEKEEDILFYTAMPPFLSGLIQNSPEMEFRLFMRHFKEGLNLVGEHNKKRIIVEGNVGDFLGYCNKGEIIVHGNAGHKAGSLMDSGEIHVHGNVGNYVGHDMIDGKIFVHGNTGEYIARGMKGGTIYLNGDYSSFSETLGGNIYHKGKLIVKDGRWVG